MYKKFVVVSMLLTASLFGCQKDDSGLSLSEEEVVQGLKEALKVGTENSVVSLHAVDGFYKSKVSIPFPEEVKAAGDYMKGNAFLSPLYDTVILKINRAAENAALGAKDIFVDAITKMTVVDAMNILNGKSDAATQYLKTNTYTSLESKFKPQIDSSLSKVGATQAWSAAATGYNTAILLTGGSSIETDLPKYTTQKALDGVFVYVADEEAKIRTNVNARVSDILKKVFGSLDGK